MENNFCPLRFRYIQVSFYTLSWRIEAFVIYHQTQSFNEIRWV
jgi:hypothetical protein